MNKMKLSKYISYILRHHPEDIGISLQDGGWVETNKLIEGINKSDNRFNISLPELKEIVDTDNKQRYSFKDNYKYIRANQGHSIKDLNMGYREVTPPKYLYHGTSKEVVSSINKSGKIKPMSRQFVHLSKDIETALNVGSRHGEPVVYLIDCEKMLKDNKKFYISENNIYLVEEVDIKYITLMEDKKIC